MPPRPPPDAAANLEGIQSVTDAALSHLGADDLLTTLLSRVREILDADTAAVLLLDNSGRQLIAAAASGLEEEVSQGVRIPVGRGFAGRIAAERRPVILDHVDHGNVLNPILLDKGIRSLAGVPLLVHGAVLGVLHVGTVHNGSSPPTMPRCSSLPPTARRWPCSRCNRARTTPPRSPCSAAWCPRRCPRRGVGDRRPVRAGVRPGRRRLV